MKPTRRTNARLLIGALRRRIRTREVQLAKARRRSVGEMRGVVFGVVTTWLAEESRRLARDGAAQRHTIKTLHGQVRTLQSNLRVSERLRVK